MVRSAVDLPPDQDMSLDAAPSGRTYRFSADPGAVAFSFGFGCSFASFSYANLTLALPNGGSGGGEDVLAEACVTVENTGAAAADEVVQIYALPAAGGGDDDGAATSRFAPRQQLVAFTRTGALLPGGTARVCLPVRKARVAAWTWPWGRGPGRRGPRAAGPGRLCGPGRLRRRGPCGTPAGAAADLKSGGSLVYNKGRGPCCPTSPI